MTSAAVVFLIAGMLVTAYAVVSVFFLRFWRETQDRLFLMFSVAFALLALQRAGLAFVMPESSGSTLLYMLRLFAFGLILFAIVDKNRR